MDSRVSTTKWKLPVVAALRCLTGGVCMLPLCADAQNSNNVSDYRRPEWSTSAVFTDVSSARVLADGSVIVADPGARELLRVSESGRKVTLLGRSGAGPSEYRTPQLILGQPRSRSLLVDQGQHRVMLLDSVGRFRHTVQFPPGASGLSGAVGADSLGRLVFLSLSPVPPTSRSLHILRWDPSIASSRPNGRLDTLGSALGAQLVQLPSKGSARTRKSGSAIFRYVPYTSEDAAAVLADGQVVVVRAETGNIEWLDGKGRAQVAHRLPTPVRFLLNDSLRQAVLPRVLRDAVPKYRAAYTPDRIIVASNGEVWVRRASTTPGARSEWTVVSKNRGVVRRALFADRTSVLAVTHDKVFVLRYDEDDLQYIEMYKLH